MRGAQLGGVGVERAGRGRVEGLLAAGRGIRPLSPCAQPEAMAARVSSARPIRTPPDARLLSFCTTARMMRDPRSRPSRIGPDTATGGAPSTEWPTRGWSGPARRRTDQAGPPGPGAAFGRARGRPRTTVCGPLASPPRRPGRAGLRGTADHRDGHPVPAGPQDAGTGAPLPAQPGQRGQGGRRGSGRPRSRSSAPGLRGGLGADRPASLARTGPRLWPGPTRVPGPVRSASPARTRTAIPGPEPEPHPGPIPVPARIGPCPGPGPTRTPQLDRRPPQPRPPRRPDHPHHSHHPWPTMIR
ncbi:hypothetical protein SVIOM74S_07457 [Streptomyces violarus]